MGTAVELKQVASDGLGDVERPLEHLLTYAPVWLAEGTLNLWRAHTVCC